MFVALRAHNQHDGMGSSHSYGQCDVPVKFRNRSFSKHECGVVHRPSADGVANLMEKANAACQGGWRCLAARNESKEINHAMHVVIEFTA